MQGKTYNGALASMSCLPLYTDHPKSTCMMMVVFRGVRRQSQQVRQSPTIKMTPEFMVVVYDGPFDQALIYSELRKSELPLLLVPYYLPWIPLSWKTRSETLVHAERGVSSSPCSECTRPPSDANSSFHDRLPSRSTSASLSSPRSSHPPLALVSLRSTMYIPSWALNVLSRSCLLNGDPWCTTCGEL